MKKIVGFSVLLFMFTLSQIVGLVPLKEAEANKDNLANKESLLDDCLNAPAHRCLYIKETNEIIRVAVPWDNFPFKTNDGKGKIILSDISGGNEQILLERPWDGDYTYSLISYAHGDKYLYFSDHESTWLGGAFIFGGTFGGMKRLDRETGRVITILTEQQTGAVYNASHDGKWVVFETFIGMPNDKGVAYYYPTENKIPVDFNGLILKNLETKATRSIEHRPGFHRFGNAVFSPNSNKIAYEEEKGSDPDDRQYDAIVENVKDGSKRSIFPNCTLAAPEWEKAKSAWIDDQFLLIRCLKKPNEFEGDFYLIDTKNNNEKKPVQLTNEMKKWNVGKNFL